MKGTLFSADFIKDNSGNFRLLELNTDTAISNLAVDLIDFSEFTTILENNTISEVYIIHKLFHLNIVEALENYINTNCPFITSVTKHLEERDTIYPTTVVDNPNIFILRMAYDENALLDSEYCKDTVNIFKLFSDNNDLGNIPGFKHLEYDHLSKTVNDGNYPDVVVKATTTTLDQPNKFYKIGKSSDTLENRFAELKTNIGDSGVITNFYPTGDTKVKSFRSLNIVYGPSLDVINLTTYEGEALFDVPTTDLLNDDTQIKTEVDTKHYYEFSTNYIRLTKNHSYGGLLSDEEVKKSDGTYAPISDIVTNDVLDSYIISGSPDSDVESVLLAWSHPGSDLPEGSTGTTATVRNNSQYSLDYKMVVTITTANDTVNISPGTTILVYQTSTDDIRYKFCYDIDPTDHKLVNVDGGLNDITSVEYAVLNEASTINSLDIESSDVFFVKNAGGIRFVVHNCFVEGTRINTPNGYVEIQNLKVGDEVLSRDENGDVFPSIIGEISTSIENTLLNILLSNEKTIKVTPKHPFLRGGEWVKAQDLKSGDMLTTTIGEMEIISIEEVTEANTKVYNLLNVSPNNNFFVEDILVHNKILEPPTCFSAGTLITLSDHTQKFIEEVEVGDEVFGWDGEKLVPAKVIRLDNDHTVGSHADACKSLGDEPSLYTINDTGIEFTPEHPFLTKDGWKSLVPDPNQEPYKTEQEPKVLSIGDFINRNGEWEEVKEIRVVRSNPDEPVYNLVIEDVHSYIADGIIVHNKL